MNRFVCDIECTTSNKGNCFDTTNKLVVIGILNINTKERFLFFYPNNEDIVFIQKLLNGCLFIAHNAKFDLHWVRKAGIDLSSFSVYDTQLAEFILSNQTHKYPSLDDSAIKYGFAPKLDIVKNEYWDKGIDTDKIPKEVLSAYLTQDLLLTQQVYEKQKEQFENEAKGRYKLFRLQCADLLVLEDIEYNGIVFNTEKAIAKAKEVEVELREINKALSIQVGGIPFNPASNDHVSVLLYGGLISEDIRIPVGTYKTGSKIGQTRYKIIVKQYELPRLVEPLKGTLVKKSLEELAPKYWEVNETVLKRLKLSKEAKKVVLLLNEYAKLEKLRGTYLEGYCKLIETMNWKPNTLHPTLNQCVVITGRLSSSKPNGQNADPITKLYMESRYEEQMPM
jgi:DNA polymerase-1